MLCRKTFVRLFLTTLIFNTLSSAYGDYNSNAYGYDYNSNPYGGQSSDCGNYNPCSYQPAACCTPPACSCGSGFISADLLYLRPFQDGFACGCIPEETNNFIRSDGNIVSRLKGHTKDPHFKWNAGFRLGVGYQFNRQSWDIAAYWTHFNSNTHDHNFKWKLDFEVIDVTIGRSFCMQSFSVRPFIGVRTAVIDQKVRAHTFSPNNTFFEGSTTAVSGSNSSENNLVPDITDNFIGSEKNKANFVGVGPLIGLEADYNLGCGLSVFGGADIASLYSHYNVKDRSRSVFLNGENVCDNSADLHSCQIAYDSWVGIRWQKCFCNNMQLGLALGLEQHRYFDHNRLGEDGDFCLDGGFLSASVTF